MGLCLRRVVLQYPRLGWQVSTGIHGSFQSESVATFDWNRWQVSTGISGNLRPEYARYTGFDVIAPYIEWCNRYFGEIYPGRFIFYHLDVKTDWYNPNGKLTG